ncbi:MAG TPA: sigma-70 family RNA polymerase sigma factor [Clostridia bacterium]
MADNPGQYGRDVSAALDKYADTVRRICFLHLRQRADVEDVFQEVFLQYLQRKEAFESEEHEKAWLLRVAINRCKDLVKSFWHNRVDPLDDEMMAMVPSESHEILDAVLRLPPSERNAVYLFYYEGYSVTEIARVQNQKANTVYSHLHRARKRLYRQLGGLEHEEDD